MIERSKQRLIDMDLKKAVIIFLITSFALMIAVPVVLHGNFQDRTADLEQVREREHGEKERGSKEDKEDDDRDSGDGELRLSWGQLALLAVCAMTGIALVVWYWILVMIWAYRKAYRMGVDSGLAVLAALFFNLAAIAVLYIYAALKGTCAACGKVRNGDWKFCDRCGDPLKKECPRCGQEVDVSLVYCGSCGEKIR